MKTPVNPYLEPSIKLIPALSMLCDIRDTADEAAGENTVELYAVDAEDFEKIGDRISAALDILAKLMDEWEEARER